MKLIGSLAVLFVGLMVIGGILLPTDQTGDRAQWDAWCRNATMQWHRADVGLIGWGYGASQLQRTDHSYVVCDDGSRVSAKTGFAVPANSESIREIRQIEKQNAEAHQGYHDENSEIH